jgi:hypothetical protein
MKRISKLSLLLMVIALIAVYVPSVFASNVIVTNPADCPADTTANDIGDGQYECIPDPVTPPVDPCLASEPCLPPVDPCLTSIICPPPVDPCAPTVLPCTPEVPTQEPVVNTPAPAQTPDDGKGISFNDSDLGVSLYVGQDDNGAPVLEIYETQNQTDTGNFAVTVTQDDLAQYVENLPAENVLLKSAGHVRVYVLTTGEIAVFVGPDSEGKVHVKVFNSIPWTNVYGFTIDPV